MINFCLVDNDAFNNFYMQLALYGICLIHTWGLGEIYTDEDGSCHTLPSVVKMEQTIKPRGRYHGGRRPSSDDSFHSPAVIPLSALGKPSIRKRYHRQRTCSHISPRHCYDGNASRL